MSIMKTPRTVEISVTQECNLRCRYCSHFSSDSDVKNDLPLDEWLMFFKELQRNSIINVILQGGEPFLRKDLHELIKGVVANRMRFSILSNGTLITEEDAERISATKRCNSVQISIDGSIPTTHDAYRGRGTFVLAMEGMKHLLKHSVSVSVRVTIHKKNVDDLENTARLLLEDVGLPSFSTNSASYMGLCRANAEQVQMDVSDRSRAMEILLKLREKYNGRINAAAGPLAEGERWLAMEGARCSGVEGFPGGGKLTGCGGVFKQLGVRADGVIVPCVLMPHIELGKINRDDLGDIWRNHPELNRLRERQNVPLESFAMCKGCEYIRYCTGSCPALAYTLTGDDFSPDPDACYRRFLKAGGKLPVLTLNTQDVN